MPNDVSSLGGSSNSASDNKISEHWLLRNRNGEDTNILLDDTEAIKRGKDDSTGIGSKKKNAIKMIWISFALLNITSNQN